MRRTWVQREEVKSLQVQVGVRGRGVEWVERTERAKWEAERPRPPASFPAGFGAECLPAAPTGEGWARHVAGSSAVCPGRGPGPAASAGDTGDPAQTPHARSAYASPRSPHRTYTETEQCGERAAANTASGTRWNRALYTSHPVPASQTHSNLYLQPI